MSEDKIKEWYRKKPVRASHSWNNNYTQYESNGDRNKNLSWKIQLTIEINFVSSKDNNKDQAIHLKSDNTEFLLCDKVDGVIEELFEPLVFKYQVG